MPSPLLSSVLSPSGRKYAGLILIAGLLLFAASCTRDEATRRNGPPLTQEVYVWQRAWTDPVLKAVQEEAGSWENLALLAAEVRWRDAEPEISRPSLPFPELSRLNGSFTPVLRLGSMSAEISSGPETQRFLVELSIDLLKEWREAGLEPREFQIDFDAPTSALENYRDRLAAIREAIAPTPLIFTALPTWLPDPDFRDLAKASDGYVLQVHSFRRPETREAIPPLCDPEEARRAVQRASRLGVPFRVALPTYAYALLFDEEGQFVRLASEGTLPESFSESRQVVRLASDPEALARLVRDWQASPPPGLTGISWFRLPTSQDRWNWPIETLRAVRNGRPPENQLTVYASTDEQGLTQIFLRNAGETDEPAPASIDTNVPPANFLAGDGWNGFIWDQSHSMSLSRSRSTPPLRPGEIRPIAWLRLSPSPRIATSLTLSHATTP